MTEQRRLAAIAHHGGRIVKATGDGLLLEFPSVVNAVRCAVEVQAAVADRTAEIAEDRRIAFRIGINIGDIIVEGDDIFGDGVNVAARLQEIAPPGGICPNRSILVTASPKTSSRSCRAFTRLKGTPAYARSEDRKRADTFLRIAAGLEDPSAAEVLR